MRYDYAIVWGVKTVEGGLGQYSNGVQYVAKLREISWQCPSREGESSTNGNRQNWESDDLITWTPYPKRITTATRRNKAERTIDLRIQNVSNNNEIEYIRNIASYSMESQ